MVIKGLLVAFSIPFFLLGGLWSFVSQAFKDGVTTERAVRAFFTDEEE